MEEKEGLVEEKIKWYSMNIGDTVVIDNEPGQLYKIIDISPTDAFIRGISGIHNNSNRIVNLSHLIPAPSGVPAASSSARLFGGPAASSSSRLFGGPAASSSARPFGVPAARHMPTFAVGNFVYVGKKRFLIKAINPDTYTLSHNIGSGGAGGADVNAPKEHVTLNENKTVEGQQWLDSLYGTVPVEESEVISDLTDATCNIRPKIKEDFVKLSTMDPIKFRVVDVVKIAKTMFGYTDDIMDRYNELFDERTERGARGILNRPNRPYNAKYFEMRSGKRVDEGDPDLVNARQMERTFKKAIDSGIFTTSRHGILYRSFAKNISSAKNVCGTLNRFTSTTLVKNYADKWGTDIDAVTGEANQEGFFTTIIIPAGTRSIIPLLLFDDLSMKQYQFEVLLSPDGILKDTGFTDSGGSKIVVYLEPEQCDMPMSEILRMGIRGTNILGFIQCVFGDQVDYVGPTGGKTRKKRRKHKTKRV